MKKKLNKCLKNISFKKNKSKYFMGIFIILGFISGLFLWEGFFLKKVEISMIPLPQPAFVVMDTFTPMTLDFTSDASLTKYVDSTISFSDKHYIPEDLEFLQSAYVADSKGGQKIRGEANEALQSLAKQFYETFGKKILVISAYRSYEYQVGIKQRGCPDSLCAKAGYSEHQSGLAVDLWEATTKNEFLSKAVLKKYYDWLDKNAHLYGFHNSYQKGIDIDTYHEEPWHWRYVGVDLASLLHSENKTFSEFYTTKKN